MKTPIRLLRYLGTCFLIVGFATNVNGQFFKKLGKAAERAAEKTVERRVESETSKKTDAALDSILEPGSKGPSTSPAPNQVPGGGTNTNTGDGSGTDSNNTPTGKAGPKTLKVYTNYDFVPGNRLILYDDFSVDNIGDFPAKWNSNGSGEIVTLDDSPVKWLKLSNRTFYVPDLPETLPNDYTFEFDMITTGLNKNTSSTARLYLLLDENNSLRKGSSYAQMGIPLAQYIDAGIYVYNRFNGQNTVSNQVKKDIRNEVLDLAHVAVAVNGKRFRMWMNERKLIDLPRFIEPGVVNYIKFDLQSMSSEKTEQFVFITNVKLAEGGEDLRSKLLKDGKFSTTGILFDSGSDKIKPESYGTLKKIAEALNAESGMKINIIGHTDADGSDDGNLELSKRRAISVMSTLSDEFGVNGDRLQTDGKGEAEPVGDNATTEGKAQNRRVEFIKL
ncbi:MAG: OmpA family protein [Maribacter sp.]|nr:OmpA family protein [Maribacter sp.]